MEIMLTSFGIEQSVSPTSDSFSMFYQMPPVSFRKIDQMFMPDYELLLLCEKVIMDESSFDRLIEDPPFAYEYVAETFKALKAEGRVELTDFASILQANSERLDQMLEHDMQILDQWVAPLRESLAIWRDFMLRSQRLLLLEQVLDEGSPFHGLIMHTGDLIPDRTRNYQSHSTSGPVFFSPADQDAYSLHIIEEALASSVKRRLKKYRSAIRDMLREYLRYIDANLILSSELSVGFHDWLDFAPFYSLKFLFFGKGEDTVQEHRKQLERLFAVPFPELAIRDTSSLLRVLNDKRIDDLRQLVSDAVLGKVEFDEAFAKSILKEVLRSERRVSNFRNVLGYVTLPIGLIPEIGTPAQKVAEASVGRIFAKRTERRHRWFYMLSEIAESGEEESQ